MPPPVRQAAALPVRDGLVCLVTSRSGRRWVIPKGRIEVQQSSADAAATEAWEEAGVLGTLSAEPVGNFDYFKEGRRHRVVVYVLAVETVLGEWPEQYERRREWMTPTQAIARLDEPELQEMVRVMFAPVESAG